MRLFGMQHCNHLLCKKNLKKLIISKILIFFHAIFIIIIKSKLAINITHHIYLHSYNDNIIVIRA